ncbi:hypothetical protein Q8F55_005383 [Vanrija albida]|uniref:Enoyl reductase (ER) domain-containing protein n=1 Tax=Vanrija albida TaxID=181172 RepID=A0ABR3Q1I5_9TREE
MPDTFKAWIGRDESAATGGLTFGAIEPKVFEDDDVDVAIVYSGICATDVSALSGEFGPIAPYGPRVAGHEVVGRVIRKGPAVDHLQLGDFVGVGAQADCCRQCKWCHEDRVNYCPRMTVTYGGSRYQRGAAKGTPAQSYGGFAKHWRGSSKFAVRIPPGLDPALAAPLCCGGLTVYAPLRRWGAGSRRARNVGVVGIGGLGHMAILIAKGMGAHVTAISRGTSKREDAFALGADAYIATSENTRADFKKHRRSLDLIICTINPPELPLNDYLGLLAPEGQLVLVGVVMAPMELISGSMIANATGVSGSIIGTPEDLAELFALAANGGVTPWINKWDMDEINQAIPAAKAGKAKYRYVLVNKDNGGVV